MSDTHSGSDPNIHSLLINYTTELNVQKSTNKNGHIRVDKKRLNCKL